MNTREDELRKIAEMLPIPDDITAMERNFCIYLAVKNRSVKDAARLAFGTTASAFKIYNKPEVQRYITELQNFFADAVKKQQEQAVMSAEECMRMLTKGALGLEELTSSRLKSLEILLRIHGAFKDDKKSQQTVNIQITGMDDDYDEDNG